MFGDSHSPRSRGQCTSLAARTGEGSHMRDGMVVVDAHTHISVGEHIIYGRDGHFSAEDHIGGWTSSGSTPRS